MALFNSLLQHTGNFPWANEAARIGGVDGFKKLQDKSVRKHAMWFILQMPARKSVLLPETVKRNKATDPMQLKLNSHP